jgi:ATP-dependent protease ClpP protease subunit
VKLLNFTRPKQQPQAKLRNGPAASWYKIVNHDPGDTADLYIYDEIGYWGVTASDLLNELSALTATTINVRINSPGGDVFDGIAIYNALLSHPATVNTTVDSLAASAASFIAMAGETVTMAPHSQMMIHDASGLAIGNAADMRQMADLLDRISDNIASMYSERAGGTTKAWRTAMTAETWYSAQEAVDAGLASAVGPVPSRNGPGGTEDEPADEPMVPENTWDLSIFAHAGRDKAPAPYVPDEPGTAEPVAFDPAVFRAAFKPAQPEPVTFDAGAIRRALQEATK